MKRLLLFVPLIFLFSCSIEEEANLIDPVQRENIILEIMDYQSVPKDVIPFDYKSFNKMAQKARFSGIREDQKVKKLKTKNYVSYTFVASTISSDAEKGFYFDNYVVYEKGEEVHANIYRYYPDLKWLKDDLNFESFSGSIEVFTEQGEYIELIKMENGKYKNETSVSKKNHNKNSCELTAYETGFICTALIHPDGSSYETCEPIYNYEWSCGSGSSEVDYGDETDTGGNYEPGDSGGTGDGGGVSSPSVPMNPDGSLIFNIDLHESFTEIDKINCTYEQLLKVTSIPNILIDFFGKDALFNLSFNVVKDLTCKDSTTASGCTTKLGDGSYRIDIDEEYITDPSTPTIFIAQTLVHEAIHANLFAAVKKLNNGISPTDSTFEALYEEYKEHHEMMTDDHYIEIMKAAIKEVHPYLNDSRFLNGYDDNSMWDWDKFYEYMSYRGLHLTSKGKEYYQNNSTAIYLYESEAELNSTEIPNCN